MVEYKRINSEEGEKIYLWKKEGRSNKAISALFGRSVSTIGRELKRCVIFIRLEKNDLIWYLYIKLIYKVTTA